MIIDLPRKRDKIYLESIKMANICENHSAQSIINKSYESLKKQHYRGFKLVPTMNSCIYLKKGTLQLDECRLSLASYSNPNNLVPCIVVE